ncbi:hypothetical protein GCM10023196_020170 [Actinoallomurus vinaceus]|uniref:Membrane-associated oxidoreductase n=2 Tax=Actinoallomurus vinaceus TaxID=1080074 RepID=A0ABP8U7E3_9ACTN
MHHAQIGCQANLSDCTITKCGDIALRADHLVVDGSLLLANGTYKGIVRLHGSEIGCVLNLSNSTVAVKEGTAIEADGISVSGNLIGRKMDVTGEVDFSDAEISGSLILSGSAIKQHKYRSLDIRRTKVTGSLVLNKNFTSEGRVTLADASIGVSFEFDEATIKNVDDVALDAAGASINGDIIGDRSEVIGLVDFTAVHGASDLRIADASLHGTARRSSSLGSPIDRRRGEHWRGISLRATAASIGGDFDLRGTEFTRSLVLNKSSIGRSLLLTDVTLSADDSSALSGAGVKADRIYLDLKSKPIAEINLSGASVGILADTETSWPENGEISIDGLSYQELKSHLSIKARLLWLERATPIYSPQPYEQLADFYNRTGHIDEARRVRREALKRAYDSRGPLFRIMGKIQDLVLGFGYRPARAAAIFLALWLSSSAWYEWGAGACNRFGHAWPSICPVQASGHLSWNPFLYTLDLLVPVVDLGYGKAWDPTGISKLLAVTLVIAGWILTTTILASVARALKRS